VPVKSAISGDVVDGPLYKYTLSQHPSSSVETHVNCTSLSDGPVIIDLQFVLSA